MYILNFIDAEIHYTFPLGTLRIMTVWYGSQHYHLSFQQYIISTGCKQFMIHSFSTEMVLGYIAQLNPLKSY